MKNWDICQPLFSAHLFSPWLRGPALRRRGGLAALRGGLPAPGAERGAQGGVGSGASEAIFAEKHDEFMANLIYPPVN